jgi:uncharacterized OB-fold protein
MSNNNFVKGECRHCAGHLEFPADAAGATTACPHCGQQTELVPSVSPNKTNRSSRVVFGAGLAGLAVFVVVAGIAAAVFLVKPSGHSKISETQAASPVLTATSTVPVAPAVEAEERTNDYAIAAIKLEKTPGSSLVYVTGKIRNLTGHQRFGVKIEFGLLDAGGRAVGKATDYQPVLEPNGDWRCKALVMDSKAASARLDSIHEDQR